MADNVAAETPRHRVRAALQPLPAHEAHHAAENIYEALSARPYEVTVDPAIAERARLAVQRMVDLPPPAQPARYDLVKARHHVGRGADLTTAVLGGIDGVADGGRGLAGLSAAMSSRPARSWCSPKRRSNSGCSSAWAQGGMAAALSAGDTPEAARRRHRRPPAPGLVDREMAPPPGRGRPGRSAPPGRLGAPFDREADGAFAQSLEAAHSARPRGPCEGRPGRSARSCRR